MQTSNKKRSRVVSLEGSPEGSSAVFSRSPEREGSTGKLSPELKPPQAAASSGSVVPDRPGRRSTLANSLLQDTSTPNFDEQFGDDEKLLNEFTKLHPMLSLEATSVKTMQLVASAMEKVHIPIPEIPVVGKRHDDLFLSPPIASIGERECVCGERCLGNFIAKVRYGADTDKGFTLKEYLLPDQLKAFEEGKGLPAQRQKCLLCSRYWLNYVYILARTDANFQLSAGVSVQRFSNIAAELPDHSDVVAAAMDMPMNASLVSCTDGYRASAMLFVDEEFASRRVQRETRLGSLLFKPVVRFCSTHYKYVNDSSGGKRIVQVGVGHEDQLDGLGFRQPPSSLDFESAGAIAALKRLWSRIREEYSAPKLPAWAVVDRLSFEVGTEVERGLGMDPPGAGRLAVRMRALEERIRDDLRQLLGDAASAALSRGEKPDMEISHVPAMVAVRLLMGSCCEAYAALACSRQMHPTTKAKARTAVQSCRRLYKDSLHAAVWTSAHARFAADLQKDGISATMPTVHSVPSELSEWELGDLYARRVYTKSVFSKDSLATIALLSRCTNPGCRGWDSVVRSSLEKSDGVRRIAISALVVSMAGMHSCLHPALRLHWTVRHALLHVLSGMVTTSGLPKLAAQILGPFKEAVRRFTRNSISGEYASLSALARLDHPVALLKPSPLHMPHPGLEAACSAFAQAGQALVASGFVSSVVSCVNAAFERYSTGSECDRLHWTTGFLGKGTASVGPRCLAVDVATDAFSAAYRCNFLPFWCHGNSKRLRVTRLDSVQHAAMHSLNAANNLTLVLSDEQRMQLNRIALRHASAGILTLPEAAELLGDSVAFEDGHASGSRGPADAVDALGHAGPRQAARLLSFCKMAQISEDVLIYDLGRDVTFRQARALVRRLLVDEQSGVEAVDSDPLRLLHLVPNHSKHLYACVECRRVSNAHVVENGNPKGMQPFSEIGTNSSMVMVNSETREMHLRCAKRCSASLRAAVAFEEEMQARELEGDALDCAAVEAVISEGNGAGDSGVSTRARRDSKVTQEQRSCATLCGTENMLCIPIVGKAVRIWREWFALCSFCGAFVRFHPCNRVGSEVCCLRCDPKMLFRKEKHEKASTSAAPTCRFCGKVDPQNTGTKWRCCRAPHDTSGANASLPPPLRRVYFCPLHFRNWMPACLKTMPTRIILSHVVFGARPCYEAWGEGKDLTAKKSHGGKRRRLKVRI